MKLLILLLVAITLDGFLSEDILNKNDEELTRQKRVSVNDGNNNLRSGNADDAKTYDFPITMPYETANFSDVPSPFPTNWGSCLLYMEGITVVGINHKDDKGYQRAAFAHINGNGSKWSFDRIKDINCQVGNSTTSVGNSTSFVQFTISLESPNGAVAMYGTETAYTVNKLKFTIHFNVAHLDYWYLDYAILEDIDITKGSFLPDITIDSFKNSSGSNTTKATDLNSLNIHGMYGYSYGCSATPAIFFPAQDKIAIGLQFNNFQIEAYNIYSNNDASKGPVGIQFKHTVNDCVPTFSVGSWMSIITVLVLAAVFMFGFLMLNSVQSQDRFDDPKAKQIIINTKE